MTIDIRVNLDRSDNRHVTDYYTALIKFNETIHKPDFSAEVNSRYMEFVILKNVDMKKEGYVSSKIYQFSCTLGAGRNTISINAEKLDNNMIELSMAMGTDVGKIKNIIHTVEDMIDNYQLHGEFDDAEVTAV